jgi:hypothetical protein
VVGRRGGRDGVEGTTEVARVDEDGAGRGWSADDVT